MVPEDIVKRAVQQLLCQHNFIARRLGKVLIPLPKPLSIAYRLWGAKELLQPFEPAVHAAE